MPVGPGLLERIALHPALLQSLLHLPGTLLRATRRRAPDAAAGPRQREVHARVAEQFRGLLGLPIRRDPALTWERT